MSLFHSLLSAGDPNNGYPEYPGATVTKTNHTFPSSVDPALTAIKLSVAYPNTGTNLPVRIVMTGYHDSSASLDVGQDNRTIWARKGYMVVYVDTREGNGSSGTFDDGGRETRDIYDAYLFVVATYSAIIAANRVSIHGYSRGGGMSLLMACRYPDLFQSVASYFGISNWGGDATYGWYEQESNRQASLTTAIGGTPSTKPNEYKARWSKDSILNHIGHLALLHDVDDVSVHVDHSQQVRDMYVAAGRTDYLYSETSSADADRWTHTYPGPANDLPASEPLFFARAKTEPIRTIATSGTLKIIGSVTTKLFTVHLNDGNLNNAERSRIATLVYDTVANSYQITNTSSLYTVATVRTVAGLVDQVVLAAGATLTLTPVAPTINGVTVSNWFVPTVNRVIKSGTNKTTVLTDKVGGFQYQGYALNVAAPTGDEPVYTASGLNSLPTLNCGTTAAGGPYITGPLLRAMSGKSKFTAFLVTNGVIVDHGASSSARTQMSARSGTDYFHVVGNGGATFGQFTGAATNLVRTVIYDGTLTGNSNRLKVREDKTAKTLTFTGTIPATTESNAASIFALGKSSFAAGTIGWIVVEIIIIEDALDATACGAIEDILKAKYAI